MTLARRLLLANLLALAGLTGLPAAADAADYYSPRQYYGQWHPHQGNKYYYRKYYYKPNRDFAGYRHHYAVWQPSHPKHVYFYNPYKKRYWGRCELGHGGQPEYSMLAPEYQKGTLNEIPETAFPAPGKLPPIPESTDQAPLDLPPDDLPEGIELPGSVAGPAEG